MIYKEVIDNQLYVYLDGHLLYKRWFEWGYGKVFCDLWDNYPF